MLPPLLLALMTTPPVLWFLAFRALELELELELELGLMSVHQKMCKLWRWRRMAMEMASTPTLKCPPPSLKRMYVLQVVAREAPFAV